MRRKSGGRTLRIMFARRLWEEPSTFQEWSSPANGSVSFFTLRFAVCAKCWLNAWISACENRRRSWHFIKIALNRSRAVLSLHVFANITRPSKRHVPVPRPRRDTWNFLSFWYDLRNEDLISSWYAVQSQLAGTGRTTWKRTCSTSSFCGCVDHFACLSEDPPENVMGQK